MTASGLYGRIEGIEGDVLRLEIAPGTTVRVDRRAVARNVSGQADPAESSVP